MKFYYKLTDQNMQTRNNYQWNLGKWYQISDNLVKHDAELCTEHWFHVYTHPLLAILLNPIHADIKHPRLFRCVCKGPTRNDNNLKLGFTEVKITSEIALPEITTTQKITFGILCAKKVYSELRWNIWAKNWLNGNDRTAKSAEAARAKAAKAVEAAAKAAETAAWAARAEAAAWAAAWAVVWAAEAAAKAAEAATWAANAINFNLISIAKKSLK